MEKWSRCCSAVSNSLWPYELQHTRLPCPSPSPRSEPETWVYKLELSTEIWGKISVLKTYFRPGTMLTAGNKMVRNSIHVVRKILKRPWRSLSHNLYILYNLLLLNVVVSINMMAITPRSHIQMGELDHKEGWMSKNGCFLIVVPEKTLESPLDCKETKPVSPKEINPEYFLEGLLLKLKLQYCGHLMQRADSLEKRERLKAKEEEGSRGRDG